MLTHRHACNAIKLLYIHAGFEVPQTLFGEYVAKEFNKDISNVPMAALYAFIDEMIALLRITANYFMLSIPNKNKHGLVFYRLSIRHIKTLASIRLQCTYGLDINAHMQLRMLYENSLLWARFLVDDEAIDEFVASNSAELGNKFWHKYLAKGKAEKFLDSKFANDGYIWFDSTNEIMQELRKKVGMASHPSFIAAYMDTLYDWHSEKDSIALSESRHSSHSILSLSIAAAVIPFSIFPEIPYRLIDFTELLSKMTTEDLKHKTAEPEEYYKNVRNMLPRLFLMATRFINGLSKTDNTKSHKQEDESLNP